MMVIKLERSNKHKKHEQNIREVRTEAFGQDGNMKRNGLEQCKESVISKKHANFESSANGSHCDHMRLRNTASYNPKK